MDKLVLAGLAVIVDTTDTHLSTLDQKAAPFHQSGGQIAAGLLIDAGQGRSGHTHQHGCLFVSLLLIIHQTDHLIFFQRHHDSGAIVRSHPEGTKSLHNWKLLQRS